MFGSALMLKQPTAAGGGPWDTGFVEFTVAGQDSSGDEAWGGTLANGLSNIATYTNATAFSGGDVTNIFKATDASSALAAVSGTVDGVEIEVEGTGDDGGSDEMYDLIWQLNIEGTATGDNKADTMGGGGPQWHDTSHEVRVYGSPTDKWGLSNADLLLLKSATSGFNFAIMSDGGSASFELWRIRIRMYGTA